MLIAVSFTLIILTVLYSISLVIILIGLFRLSAPVNQQQYTVSVIVAARNEEATILPLLHALTSQNYPKQNIEIIIVDDGSEDSTVSRIREFTKTHHQDHIHLLTASNRELVVSPKKNALHTGIKKATGEIVVLTDADCQPPVNWIKGIVEYFTPDTGMVIGFSPYELPALKTIPSYLFAIESTSLAAVAAGTCGWGFPATCNGRNLAYRKCVYAEMGGFEKIKNHISGDDDLFLKLVRDNSNWKIRYAYQSILAVPTYILTGLSQFIQQRIRHASKGFLYNPVQIIVLSIVYIYNVLLLLFIPLGLTFSYYTPLYCFAFKIFFEFILLSVFTHHMGRTRILIIFPLAVLLHVPYIASFGLAGQIGKFQWKKDQQKAGDH
jgi:cellulose synthase/poly-beta-1,6-N-acetylglucosamine synthase-like glycosyltransferase